MKTHMEMCSVFSCVIHYPVISFPPVAEDIYRLGKSPYGQRRGVKNFKVFFLFPAHVVSGGALILSSVIDSAAAAHY